MRLRVDGAAVTPTGRTESEMLIAPVNPFIPAAVNVTFWPEEPVVRERLVGATVMEKSGGGAAATLSVKVVVCESKPDVPVSVIVLELAEAVGAAVSVIAWDAPGLRTKEAGFAVMPAGSPERTTATDELKPFNPVVVAEICGLSTPAVRATVAGVAVSEKSVTGAVAADFELQPVGMNTMQGRAKSRTSD